MLILFDIDGTLISTGGAGVQAMRDAGRELFGERFSIDGVEFAGRLDPLIIRDLLGANGVEPSPETPERFRAAYESHLTRRLADGNAGRALPGVLPLLRVLAGTDGVGLGLLTGNYERTGAIKLRACGIDPAWFVVSVWGDDSPHDPPAREHLPPVGMERYRLRTGRVIHAAHVTIVGDTPHDVACARAHGCRSVAVATGKYTPADLAAAGADLVVRNLSATDEVAQWLTSPPRR